MINLFLLAFIACGDEEVDTSNAEAEEVQEEVAAEEEVPAEEE